MPSFTLLFDYDLYANSKVLAAIEGHVGQLPDDTLKLFSHIIAAHEIWNKRISGETPELKVWERIPISEMGGWLNRNNENTRAIIENLDETQLIRYTNTQGNSYDNSIGDILMHVITHNTYHRGQIARNMRENGLEPVDTNYIVFNR